MESHLINDIEMMPAISDKALYVKKQGKQTIGLCGSYMDDSLNDGSVEFER